MAEFDYIVVGGGTAGCIVAARLAGDPFEIGYRPETNTRSSSSICYLHPAQRNRAK